MQNTDVTVVIPTFRRLDGLRLAVSSVFSQIGCGAFDIIIIDNDPDGGADNLARNLITQAPAGMRLRYFHEPNAGVANARNLAVTHTETRLIAFLDDDQSAPPHWLATLLKCHAQFPAAVTFGPVLAVLPNTAQEHRAYFEGFFSRLNSQATGYTDESYGCGNCLLDLSLLPKARPLFDSVTNETGGEDDLLFKRVRVDKGRFAWCAEAPAYEHVPLERATLKYTLKRAMAYGTGPITQARLATPPNWPLVIGWMGVGVYKVAVNGVIYAAKTLTRADDRAEYLDRTARGFGKLYWWQDRRFYGRARL